MIGYAMDGGERVFLSDELSIFREKVVHNRSVIGGGAIILRETTVMGCLVMR